MTAVGDWLVEDRTPRGAGPRLLRVTGFAELPTRWDSVPYVNFVMDGLVGSWPANYVAHHCRPASKDEIADLERKNA